MRAISLTTIGLIVLGLFGCGKDAEKEALKTEVATLKAQQENYERDLQSLNQIGLLLDSIEAKDEEIDLTLEQGMSYQDYTGRIGKLNESLVAAREQIANLERQLAKSWSGKSKLNDLVARMKQQLKEKEDKIVRLEESVAKLKQENEALMATVILQKEDLEAQEKEIQKSMDEISKLKDALATLETEATQTEVNAKESKAENYFKRGQLKEEIAKKIIFARKKRRDAFQEAYDLYKMSFELGKTEALEKMTELEDKIGDK